MNFEIDLLTKFKLSEISSLKFQKQFEVIQKLNLSPMESVVESIIFSRKIEILIHELLLIQTWKIEIYPLLKDISITSYFIFYHEANLVNLLQQVFCDSKACKESGESLLDLLNFLNAKLLTLVSWKHSSPKSAKQIMNISDKERFEDSIKDLEFAICISSLGLYRSITDQIKDLSISCINNMLVQNDMVTCLVHIIQSSPWIRKNDGKFELFKINSWESISPEDLAIVGLVGFNESVAGTSVEAILSLRDVITQETVDQLPPLVDLQRYLEQLRMMNPPDTLPSSIGIQPISEILTEITENQDYHKIAETQRKVLASLDQKEFAQRLSKLYELDELDDLLDDPKCGKCGSFATQRCSLCKLEWYCGRACQVKAWPQHKPICDLSKTALK